MNRRQFLNQTAAVTAAGAIGSAFAQSSAMRPNILWILSDDLGYGDLSCFGRPDYKTPVLDKMAQDGMKFTDNYAAAPVCTPTRTAFITGRYPQRLQIGLQEPLSDAELAIGIPPDHPTVATQMKKAGYETSLIGKWHLGNLEQFGPNHHGFDEFFGINGSSADYFTHNNTAGRYDLYENTEPAKVEGYLTDLFTERAIQYLSRKHTNPFFLALHYNAPHWPWEGPKDKDINHDHRADRSKGTPGSYAQAAGGSRETYAEMVKAMDSGIGDIFKALRSAKIERETIVIFTSDNGGERYSYNWPFSSDKLNLWEGGLRVPALVRWPGMVATSKVTNQALTTLDWTATIMALGGAKADPAYPLDGEDITAVMIGKRQPFDRTLFFRITTQDAARMGNWKYLREGRNEHLFDLAKDPGEKADLRLEHPDVFETLRQKYQAWNAQMLPNPVRRGPAA
jgi:arylsulfatase A-like enzyme